MKTMRMLAALFAMGVMLAPVDRAQDKPKPAEQSKPPEGSKPVTPLKVLVVFSEFEGDKKISNLPYTFFVNADEHIGRPFTSLRVGLRVPVTVATKESSASVQYVDVGTNIDCTARSAEDGRFRLDLSLERSSVYSAGPEKKPLDWSPGDQPLSTQPIIRTFRESLNLLLRDAQTVQGTMATDPVSGRVLRVDVTLNVVK